MKGEILEYLILAAASPASLGILSINYFFCHWNCSFFLDKRYLLSFSIPPTTFWNEKMLSSLTILLSMSHPPTYISNDFKVLVSIISKQSICLLNLQSLTREWPNYWINSDANLYTFLIVCSLLFSFTRVYWIRRFGATKWKKKKIACWFLKI